MDWKLDPPYDSRLDDLEDDPLVQEMYEEAEARRAEKGLPKGWKDHSDWFGDNWDLVVNEIRNQNI